MKSRTKSVLDPLGEELLSYLLVGCKACSIRCERTSIICAHNSAISQRDLIMSSHTLLYLSCLLRRPADVFECCLVHQ